MCVPAITLVIYSLWCFSCCRCYSDKRLFAFHLEYLFNIEWFWSFFPVLVIQYIQFSHLFARQQKFRRIYGIRFKACVCVCKCFTNYRFIDKSIEALWRNRIYYSCGHVRSSLATSSHNFLFSTVNYDGFFFLTFNRHTYKQSISKEQQNARNRLKSATADLMSTTEILQ